MICDRKSQLKLELLVTILSMNADILMRCFINRLINYESFAKIKAEMLKNSKFMLIHQPFRARFEYNNYIHLIQSTRLEIIEL